MSNPHRDQLSQRLRQARKASGLSGNRFAATLGWPQSRVSKIETGQQMVSREDLETWIRAAEITNPDTTDELHKLLQLAHVEYEDWRENYRKAGGAASAQVTIGQREARARVLSEFWPAMMPGLVQTAAYAREALTIPGGPTTWGTNSTEIERMVAARIERQQILYDPTKTFRIVLAEAALHTRFETTATLRGQLDRLVAVAGLDTVDLRILPLSAPWPVFPLATFKVFDEDFVMLEQPVGEHVITDPEQIAAYQHFFDVLADAALAGDDAIALIHQASAA